MRIIIFLLLFFTTSASATECAELAPLTCLESLKCSLDCKRQPNDSKHCAGKNSYFCRSKQGICERGKNQSTISKEECEAKAGCIFDPGYCFCACDFKPDCVCECGGGVPPNCLEK